MHIAKFNIKRGARNEAKSSKSQGDLAKMEARGRYRYFRARSGPQPPRVCGSCREMLLQGDESRPPVPCWKPDTLEGWLVASVERNSTDHQPWETVAPKRLRGIRIA